MKRLIYLTCIVAFFTFCTVNSYAEGDPGVTAKACILIEGKTGQVLYEQNADEKLFPASTTKILTAVVALENGRLDQVMTASQEAVYDIGKDGMNVGIMPGEEVRMEDLLHALLVRSANETANIIAENISGSKEEFMKLENQRAVELGAKNTHFENPCGAHNPEHYTCARDMVLFAKRGMEIPKFREIVAKQSYTMYPTNKHSKPIVLISTNHIFKYKSQFYSQATGIKTGYTGQAGNNLVSSAVDSNGTELIAAVMGLFNPGSSGNIFVQSKNLLEYGFSNFSIQNVVKANTEVQQKEMSGALGDNVLRIVTAEDLNAFLPNDKSKRNEKKNIFLNENLSLPIEKGDVVGYMTCERNGTELARVKLLAGNSITGIVPNIHSKNAENFVLNYSVFRIENMGILLILMSLVFGGITFLFVNLKSKIMVCCTEDDAEYVEDIEIEGYMGESEDNVEEFSDSDYENDIDGCEEDSIGLRDFDSFYEQDEYFLQNDKSKLEKRQNKVQKDNKPIINRKFDIFGYKKPGTFDDK